MRTWIVVGTLAAALGTTTAASAQTTGRISGTVSNSVTREPVVGAQIQIPGTQLGALTDVEGRFLLANVPPGVTTLRLRLIGYASAQQTVTVAAGETATVEFRLQPQAIALDALVVTALGIEREERSLGYAVQSLSSDRLRDIPKIDVVSALAGQAAGIQVISSSSRPGAGARVVIRGESSFTGAGQPLWVIDGVPISMDTDAQGGFTGREAFPLESGQAGNRGIDIDPNNIEEISVLRGAAATALYGARAAHGAIIVTTKKGAPGGQTRFTLTTRMQFEQPIIMGKQTSYTSGLDGFFCNGRRLEQGGWCEPGYPGSDPSTTNNWGPHKDSLSQAVLDHEGSVRMVDPREDFYRTGRLAETSLSAMGGIAGGGSYNLGFSYVSQGGIQPFNSDLRRLNLNANVTLKWTDRLEANTTVLHTRANNAWQNEGWQGREQDLMFVQPNLDIRNAWNTDGTPVMFGSNSPHWEWLAQNEFRVSETTRWIASQYLRYDIAPGLSLSNRIGLDTYLDHRQQREGERPWRTAQNLPSGGTRQQRYVRTQINNDLVLSLNRTPVGRGLTLSGLLGANVNLRENNELVGEGTEITIPGFYNLSNFEELEVGETLTERQRLVGVYGQATLDYRDWAFLTVTGRNDWSSTLPLDNNSYFYPSASLSLVFTDALGWRSRWLDYGKLRLSVAKVGSDAPPYRLSTRYFAAGRVDWPFQGQLGFLQGNRLGNPDLKPESTREYEVGLELYGIGGRARVDLSYYDKRSYDQIFSVPSSAATGFTSITQNAGDLRNEGIEVSLTTVPLETLNARWDLRVNWSSNKSSVLALAPGVTSIYLAGYSWPQVRIMAGEEYGVIWGYGYERNEKGQILIGDDGFPLWDDELKVIGHSQPDWLGNLFTSFRYGPVTVSGLLDVRRGGDILNFDLNYTITRGIAAITDTRGDTYVYDGVNVNTGQKNTVELVRNRDFWVNYGAYDHHENQVEDGSFVKLRELSISYELPASLLGRLGIESATLFATGSNLKTWTDFSYGDPEGSNYGSTNAGGAAFRFFLPPSTRSVTWGLRASF